jgi:hypothetical protein
MQYLNHAISLYQDNERVKSLKIAYALAEDRQERIAIRLSLFNLGHRIKQEKQE